MAVDEGGVLWQQVVHLAADHPWAAALVLAERVVECLRTSPERKRRVLSHLAAEAVIERAECHT